MSIQTLVKKSKDVVFEKDKLDYRDMSTVLALLPVLADWASISDVEYKFHYIKKRKVRLI